MIWYTPEMISEADRMDEDETKMASGIYHWPF
jgi:hypothetical protein